MDFVLADRHQRLLSIVMIAKEINYGTVRGRDCKLKTLFNEINEVKGEHTSGLEIKL